MLQCRLILNAFARFVWSSRKLQCMCSGSVARCWCIGLAAAQRKSACPKTPIVNEHSDQRRHGMIIINKVFSEGLDPRRYKQHSPSIFPEQAYWYLVCTVSIFLFWQVKLSETCLRLNKPLPKIRTHLLAVGGIIDHVMQVILTLGNTIL